jgi:hypothetical protein
VFFSPVLIRPKNGKNENQHKDKTVTMKIRSISRRFLGYLSFFFSGALIACISVVSINLKTKNQKDKKETKIKRTQRRKTRDSSKPRHAGNKSNQPKGYTAACKWIFWV